MYARALFDAARERSRLKEVHEELRDFVRALDEVPELGALVRNPELDRQAKAAALAGVLADADELVRNFVLVVAEKGRAAELPEIARELDELVAREEGRLKLDAHHGVPARRAGGAPHRLADRARLGTHRRGHAPRRPRPDRRHRPPDRLAARGRERARPPGAPPPRPRQRRLSPDRPAPTPKETT